MSKIHHESPPDNTYETWTFKINTNVQKYKRRLKYSLPNHDGYNLT